jgi:manganese/zinc/iron transport system substrate-binding protein
MLPWLNIVLYNTFMIIKNTFRLCFYTAALMIILMGSLSYLRANAAEFQVIPPSGKPNIITTTAHIADMVKNMAGDAAHVHALIGTGLDPHLYRPLRSDMIALNKADLVVFNGKNLEGKMQDRLLKMRDSGKAVVALGDELNINDIDPHIWMDPQLWVQSALILKPVLIKLMPQEESRIEENTRHYIAELEALDQDIAARIQGIPQAQRVLITAHDAFGYFGKAYGIEVIGIQGLSTASEAGLKQIETIVDLCSDRNIAAIFAESSVSDKNIKAIIEGVQNKGYDLKLGGTLYSDSLGVSGSGQDSYIGMMRYNAQIIASTLSGSIPNE